MHEILSGTLGTVSPRCCRQRLWGARGAATPQKRSRFILWEKTAKKTLCEALSVPPNPA